MSGSSVLIPGTICGRHITDREWCENA
jgi:hypothetical protein